MRHCTLVWAFWKTYPSHWLTGSTRHWRGGFSALPHVSLRALELGGHSRHADPRIERMHSTTPL